MASRTLLLIWLLPALLTGCGSSDPEVPEAPVSAAPETPAPNDVPTLQSPRFREVAVFINIAPFDQDNGCSTTFTPHAEVAVKQSLTCGHPGAVSRLTWQFTKTSEQGDHYVFERVFPVDGSDAPLATRTSQVKEIIYQGAEQILFQDEHHMILIRPVHAEET